MELNSREIIDRAEAKYEKDPRYLELKEKDGWDALAYKYGGVTANLASQIEDLLQEESTSIPSGGELMVKRHTEYKLFMENAIAGDSSSFYAGFRRCFNWMVNY